MSSLSSAVYSINISLLFAGADIQKGEVLDPHTRDKTLTFRTFVKDIIKSTPTLLVSKKRIYEQIKTN